MGHMSAAAVISIDEYLESSYDPDCDYVDGELRERNVGEYDHARTQGNFCYYLRARERDWKILVASELRVQVSAKRFRILDVCVVSRGNPVEQIVRTPPLLAIEVLSPRDTLESIQERIDDYLAMGVPCVWVVNPKTRRAWIYAQDSIREAKDGLLRAGSIEVPLAAIFDDESLP